MLKVIQKMLLKSDIKKFHKKFDFKVYIFGFIVLYIIFCRYFHFPGNKFAIHFLINDTYEQFKNSNIFFTYLSIGILGIIIYLLYSYVDIKYTTYLIENNIIEIKSKYLTTFKIINLEETSNVYIKIYKDTGTFYFYSPFASSTLNRFLNHNPKWSPNYVKRIDNKIIPPVIYYIKEYKELIIYLEENYPNIKINYI